MWKCVSDIGTPIARVDGEIACLSTDSKNCMWSACKDGALVGTIPSKVNPLKCGSDHKSKYGDSGYDNPAHWCAKGDKLLPKQAPVEPVYTPVGPSSNPVSAPVVAPVAPVRRKPKYDYLFYIIDLIVSIVAITIALLSTRNMDNTSRVAHVIIAILFRYVYLGYFLINKVRVAFKIFD